MIDKIIEYLMSVKKRNVNRRVRSLYESGIFHQRIIQIISNEVQFGITVKNEIDRSFNSLERLLKLDRRGKERKLLNEITSTREYINEICQGQADTIFIISEKQKVNLKNFVDEYEKAYEDMFVHTNIIVFLKIVFSITAISSIYILYLLKPHIDIWLINKVFMILHYVEAIKF